MNVGTQKFTWGGTANTGATSATGWSNPMSLPKYNKAISANTAAGTATIGVYGSLDGGVSFPFNLGTLSLSANAGGTVATGAFDTVALDVTGISGATVSAYGTSIRNN